jgi:DNA helicase-2/ATP-dependent DNA helicase PcrA
MQIVTLHEGNIISEIFRWKDTGVSTDLAMQQARELGLKFPIKAADAYAKYEGLRTERQSLDFSDLILTATKLLRTEGRAKEWFHEKFKHFVVDEFQDVNWAQVEFLRTAMSPKATIWAVGDEDQSIYSFRGSHPGYCTDFMKFFPPAKTMTLTESFRCSPMIVNIPAQLISRNRKRFDKTLVPTRPGSAEEFVIFKRLVNEDQEPAWIAGQISKLMKLGGSMSSIAVLFRSATIGASIQTQLEKQKIPLRVSGMQSFWDTSEVKLFVSSVAMIAGDNRFGGREAFGETRVGFKCRSLAEEMVGQPVGAYANPLARVLWDFRPQSLDADRKGTWMASVETVLNILLDMNDATKFLAYAHEMGSAAQKTDTEGVTLSTLHSAKGLERDVVFLAGCETNVMPHHKNTNPDEERRLMYVGMTRARHQLIVSYARKRSGKAQEPSPYLMEAALPKEKRVGAFKWMDPNLMQRVEDKKSAPPANPSRCCSIYH